MGTVPESIVSEVQSEMGSKLGIPNLAEIGSNITAPESRGVTHGSSGSFTQKLTLGSQVGFEVKYRRTTGIVVRV